MTTKDTGGPAFPSGLTEADDDTVESLHKGMTLRDYFAAKAMHAFIVEPQCGGNNLLAYEFGKRLRAAPGTPELYAAVAYMMADAMLAERNKQ